MSSPPVSAARTRLINEIAGRVPVPDPSGCVRVAIDGVDGVGKSMFAHELTTSLHARGRCVVQVSEDGFHHRREIRYRQGRDSPEGFWRDSYDVASLIRDVLEPLGPGGSRRYRSAVHDLATDRMLDPPWRTAAPGTVLVVDGLFLHRDELIGYWDFSVLLDAPFEVTVARMARRDGSPPDPRDPGVQRYVQGQQRYFAACAPHRRADVVIDNTHLDRPRISATRPHG